MKEMNRREFLTLSGAAVVALSLAGCGGGPSAPPAPPASEDKETALFRAINEVWDEVSKEVVSNPSLHICKSVAYCLEAADLAKFTASPFETHEPDSDNGDFPNWILNNDEFHAYDLRKAEMIKEIENKYGGGSYLGTAGVYINTREVMQLNRLYPRNQSEVMEFVRYLVKPGMASPHPEQLMIGLYCPTIKGKTYAVAVMVSSQH